MTRRETRALYLAAIGLFFLGGFVDRCVLAGGEQPMAVVFDEDLGEDAAGGGELGAAEAGKGAMAGFDGDDDGVRGNVTHDDGGGWREGGVFEDGAVVCVESAEDLVLAVPPHADDVDPLDVVGGVSGPGFHVVLEPGVAHVVHDGADGGFVGIGGLGDEGCGQEESCEG